MRPSALALTLAAGASGAPVPLADAQAVGAARLAQVTIHERIIIRVPSARVSAPLPVATRWVEKTGPKCIAAAELAGAIVTAGDSVDLVLKGGRRVRAQFADDCDALGYYGGFYVKPSADGQICAGRDVVRSRSGDSCPIGRFKLLAPKPVKPVKQRKP